MRAPVRPRGRGPLPGAVRINSGHVDPLGPGRMREPRRAGPDRANRRGKPEEYGKPPPAPKRLILLYRAGTGMLLATLPIEGPGMCRFDTGQPDGTGQWDPSFKCRPRRPRVAP